MRAPRPRRRITQRQRVAVIEMTLDLFDFDWEPRVHPGGWDPSWARGIWSHRVPLWRDPRYAKPPAAEPALWRRGVWA